MPVIDRMYERITFNLSVYFQLIYPHTVCTKLKDSIFTIVKYITVFFVQNYTGQRSVANQISSNQQDEIPLVNANFQPQQSSLSRWTISQRESIEFIMTAKE
jgi:hypothetical protein